MKKIIQIFCIIFLFFMTVNLNLTELNTVNEKSINSIQTLDNTFKLFNNTKTNDKVIVLSSTHNSSEIFQNKNSDKKSSFGGFKNSLTPTNSQFSLLLSYIYNKSYLENQLISSRKTFLSEIYPNAP